MSEVRSSGQKQLTTLMNMMPRAMKVSEWRLSHPSLSCSKRKLPRYTNSSISFPNVLFISVLTISVNSGYGPQRNEPVSAHMTPINMGIRNQKTILPELNDLIKSFSLTTKYR